MLNVGVGKVMVLLVALFLLLVVIVFSGVLSGFGKMPFGKPGEGAGAGHHHTPAFSLSRVLGNGIMIVMAFSVIIMGLKVPGFIDNTIRTCIHVLGAR